MERVHEPSVENNESELLVLQNVLKEALDICSYWVRHKLDEIMHERLNEDPRIPSLDVVGDDLKLYLFVVLGIVLGH